MATRFTLQQLSDHFALQELPEKLARRKAQSSVPEVSRTLVGTPAYDTAQAARERQIADTTSSSLAELQRKQQQIEKAFRAARTPEEMAALPPDAATVYALRALGAFGKEAIPSDYPVGKPTGQQPAASAPTSPVRPKIRNAKAAPSGLGVPGHPSTLNAKDLFASFSTVAPNKALNVEQNAAFSPRLAIQAQKMLAAAGLDDLSAYGGPGPRFQAAAKAKTLSRLIDALSGRRADLDRNQLSTQANDINNQRTRLGQLIGNTQSVQASNFGTGADLLKALVGSRGATRSNGGSSKKSTKSKGKAPSLNDMKSLFSALDVDESGQPKDPVAYQAARAYLDTVANTQGSDSPVLETLANQRLSQMLPQVADAATLDGLGWIPGSDQSQLKDAFAPILNSANPLQNLASTGAFAFDPASRRLRATAPVNGVEPSDIPSVGLNVRDPISRYIAAALLRNQGQ